MEPADGDEMHRPPVPRDDRLLGATMLARTALMALTSAAVTLGWFAWRLHQGTDLALARTEVFTLVAVCQWFNVLNCQSTAATVLGPGLWRNRWLAGGLALSVALQAAVLYVPFMNALFYTVPLPAASVLPLLGLASSVLWVEELRKAVTRARRRGRRPAELPNWIH
jgi:magnesium-transporting ATPase (P-type)